MTGDSTATNAGYAPELLLRILDEILAVYGQLDALSQRQSDLIDEEDHEPLLTLLEERQLLINHLVGLNERADAMRRRLEAEGGRADDPAVGDRLRGIARIGAAIEERDSMDRRAMDARRQSVLTELSGIGRARTALSTYGRQDQPNGPKFQDVEG